MSVSEQLLALGFTLEDANNTEEIYVAYGNNDTKLYVMIGLSEGAAQIVRMPLDEEIPTTIVNWNHIAPAFFQLLGEWMDKGEA